MGELPVVDAFQSHPFNGHLRREGWMHKDEGFMIKQARQSELEAIYLHLN